MSAEGAGTLDCAGDSPRRGGTNQGHQDAARSRKELPAELLQKEPVQGVELAHQLNKPGVAHLPPCSWSGPGLQLHVQLPQPHGIDQVECFWERHRHPALCEISGSVHVTAIKLLDLVARKECTEKYFLSLVLKVGSARRTWTRQRWTDGARRLPVRDVNWTRVRGSSTRGPHAEATGRRQTDASSGNPRGNGLDPERAKLTLINLRESLPVSHLAVSQECGPVSVGKMLHSCTTSSSQNRRKLAGWREQRQKAEITEERHHRCFNSYLGKLAILCRSIHPRGSAG